MNIKKISIKNFRVFKEKTTFELRPFTILTGPNNSGKSSFIKFLLLIKEGITELKFNKGLHNLESYESILNWELQTENLEFEIENTNSKKINFKYHKPFILSAISKQPQAILRKMKYYANNEKIFEFSAKQKIIKSPTKVRLLDEVVNVSEHITLATLKISLDKVIDIENLNKKKENYDWYLKNLNQLEDSSVAKDLFDKGLLFHLYVDKELKTLEYINEIKISQDYFFNYYEERLPKNILANYSLFDIFDYIRINLLENAQNYILSNLKENPSLKNSNCKLIKSPYWDLLFSSNVKKDYSNLTNIDNQRGVLDRLLTEITFTKSFDKINYVSPRRSSHKHYIEDKSEFDMNNIATDFSKKSYKSEFLKKCLDIIGIEGWFVMDKYENNSAKLSFYKNNKKQSLSQLGYGVSQILPIILKIHNFLPEDDFSEIKKDLGTLIIEEPEANLHPNLQSKLAELFVYIQSSYKINFIIETHSEYFIRKLQYLTAKEELKTDDSVIYYFNDDKYLSKTEPKVKEIFINKEGGLTDSFGPGFFDEATKLQFDLIRLQKQQFN